MSAPPMPNASQPSKPIVAIKIDQTLSQDQAQPRAPEHVLLRWIISRSAIKSLAPSGKGPTLYLECHAQTNHPPRWVLRDPTANTTRDIKPPQADSPVHITQSTHGIHIQSPDLRAHLQTHPSLGLTLVYVHASIFSALQIPGGRYEPIGCSLSDTGV